MGELFAEFGDFVFTLVISYISAIEFLYVVRHLYHYSFNHDANVCDDNGENFSQLQDSMRQQLENAKNKEAIAGTQVMKDGVLYKDGYRLEAQQDLIDQLKEQLKNEELSNLRRQELDKELTKQMKLAEQLRKQLTEAEAKYQRELKQEEELKAKNQLEEQQKREKEEMLEAEKRREEERKREEQDRQEAEKLRIDEQRRREEEDENLRRLQEAEKQKEQEQRQLEEQDRQKAEEQARMLEEAEKLREEEQRRREEEEENLRRLQEAEKQREQEQRKLEEEKLNEAEKAAMATANKVAAVATTPKDIQEIEQRLEQQIIAAEEEPELTEKERQLIESIKKRDIAVEEEGNEQKEAELLRKILEARAQLGEESEEEQSFRLLQREKNKEDKQRRIEENALLFMEAEKEMAELQSKMFDAVEKREYGSTLDSAPQTPVIEEPCIKRIFSPLMGGEAMHHTVKTQLAQDLDKPYLVSTKTLLFPGVSDDASSIDPASSQQSSFSTQPSEETTTGTESLYPAQERQEPDGEDTALNNLQYSEDYLRSLDGIKQRPLMREDGSRRRRAFKKRRSSNSSNSSRDSRHSRDEELKMFTSLEEEEMRDTADSEFTPIRYTSEPNLKVKGHHRRHKRSPAKDMRHGDDSLRSSLERLGEETNDPWGELKPEHYKHTEFWKREKTLSIDEETEFDTAANMPNASSFEEATQKQNEEALTALQKHSANKEKRKENSDVKDSATEEPARSDKTNLQASQTAEGKASAARSSDSLRLQFSSRVEGINQNEKTIDSTDKPSPTSIQNTPTISVQTPLDFGSWRDEHGLIMEGLSDFYDFTASINPSRSRNPSPANTAPNSPFPKNVSFKQNISNEENTVNNTVEIYDDTENLDTNEFRKENIIKFIDSIYDNEGPKQNLNKSESKLFSEVESNLKIRLHNMADDPSKSPNQTSLVPLVNIIDDSNDAAVGLEVNEFGDSEMNALVSSSRSQQSRKSRSRSKSPLPTPDNLQRSLENRRYKMIKHNEDVLEKLIESKLLPELTTDEEIEPKSNKDNKKLKAREEDKDSCSQEQMDTLVQSLRVERSRSRSKSPMRLPTPENLSKSLEKRRNRLIERNDEFIKQLEKRSLTPESPTLSVEYVYEMESSSETSTASIQSLAESRQSGTSQATVEEEEDDCSREKMELLVQSLRAAQSRSRSKSPMHLQESENYSQTGEKNHYYSFKNPEELKITQHAELSNASTISINIVEVETETDSAHAEDEECSREQMDLLVQSLRVARSRSRSKSPMRLPTAENLNKSLDDRRNKLIERNDDLLRHIEERAKMPEPSALTVEYVYEFEKAEEMERSRHSRSKSPLRSHTTSRSLSPRLYENQLTGYGSNIPSTSLSPQNENYDEFHVMLNLEGSKNRTLSISTEEQESLFLANRQRQLDEEALEKLKSASEEIELRTLSPLALDKDELNEQQSRDLLADLPITERAKLLKKSPTTPDYDRTISEEMRDVEHIRQKMLEKGFKRSTYVGESMNLGSEFEPLRAEAARFQRSRSPSPSYSAIADQLAKKTVEENRKIQDIILQELISKSGSSNDSNEPKLTGAIPKAERLNSCEIELTLTNEMEDIICIQEQVFSSSSQSTSATEHRIEQMEEYEEMRQRNEEFKSSVSTSRSPLKESQLQELADIEAEAVKPEQKSIEVHEISFHDFSRHLNPDFFDTERRASDSALMKDDIYLEPDEYHHHRRFSLAQEQPVEEYPSDDYIFVQKVEVRTRSGSRTWLREDFYSEEPDTFLANDKQPQKSSAEIERATESDGSEHHMEIEENELVADDDEDYSNASDDDRQTVVEVDDEIDEDISDFNERGPAEESHHETSECEEAEREMDRYADREASDWNRVANVENITVNEGRANEIITNEEDEGAVGGLGNSPYDSDSFAIDQIYDEAIKNRKQSGILREYDSILRQISSSSDIDEQYLLWSKTQEQKKPKNIELNTQFLNTERKDCDMRYLGDANSTARQSTRLRSRYGYSPILQAACLENDLDVDMNYKPKREYNWRKNFKLDEDNGKEDKEITIAEIDFQNKQQQYEDQREQPSEELNDKEQCEESIALYSPSPERNFNIMQEECAVNVEANNVFVDKEEFKQEIKEKPKKKKTKKKTHKETKCSLEETMNKEDEEAYDNQMYSRRSSSIQMDTDTPKRKSCSRRSSKSSITNEDSLGVLSPRGSMTFTEPLNEAGVAKETTRTKKMKKRKKVKETMAYVVESPIEHKEELQYNLEEPLNDIPTVSAVISPESSMANILSTLSPQNSVCVTPASTDSSVNVSVEELRETSKENTTTSNSSSTTTSSQSTNSSRTSSIVTTPVDTFDILKDANFYPLF